MTLYTAVFTPILSRQRFFTPLYGYGYGGTRNRIGTVRIRPYPVYGTVLSTTVKAWTPWRCGFTRASLFEGSVVMIMLRMKSKASLGVPIWFTLNGLTVG